MRRHVPVVDATALQFRLQTACIRTILNTQVNAVAEGTAMGRNGLLLTQLVQGVAPDTRRAVEAALVLGVALMGAVAYSL